MFACVYTLCVPLSHDVVIRSTFNPPYMTTGCFIEFLQRGNEEDVCVWIEAFEFLDLNNDDKLKKIGEAKYNLFADNTATAADTDTSLVTDAHEIKCQVTVSELPIPSDYSQVKRCPGRYIKLYIDDAETKTFNLNLCLSSVDIDIGSYDEILERSTRFAPADPPGDDVKDTQDDVTKDVSPAPPKSLSPSPDVILQTVSPEPPESPVKAVSSVPLSNVPSRLREFGSSLLNIVTRKDHDVEKGLSDTVRRLQCLKADTATLVGLLPLEVRQIEYVSIVG